MELPRPHCLYPTVQSLRALGTEKGRLCTSPEPVLGHVRGKSCAKRNVPSPGSSTQSLERGRHQQCWCIHVYTYFPCVCTTLCLYECVACCPYLCVGQCL